MGPVVVVAVCSLLLAGCGGSPTSTPSTSPSHSPSTSPSSPKPTHTGPPKQPEGKYGVTYKILDWARYHDDPPVLAYKHASQAYAGSVNHHKVLPALTRRYSKAMARVLVGQVDIARREHLHVARVAKVRVLGSHTKGHTAKVQVCEWVASTDFRERSGRLYQNPKVGWRKGTYTLARKHASWIVTGAKPQGMCKGGAPR